MTLSPLAFIGMHQIYQNEYVKQYFDKPIALSKENKKANIVEIKKYIAEKFPSALIANRKQEAVISRHSIISILHEYRSVTGLTLKEIGGIIGGQDHATVIHAVKSVNNWFYTKDEPRLLKYHEIRKEMVKLLVAITK